MERLYRVRVFKVECRLVQASVVVNLDSTALYCEFMVGS